MAKKKPAEKASQEEAEKMIESGEASIPPEAIVEKPSLDEQIGKGLTPKKEHSELDQEKNDYAQHPKLAKFKTQQGVNKHD